MNLDDGFGISIGAVERATGIPANTLRTWERRYGFPLPKRTDGGQRLYDPAVIDHLRAVARALELGHRPAQVLKLSASELRELAGVVTPLSPQASQVELDERWIRLVVTCDGEALEAAFAATWARVGGLRFLADRVVPFLVEVGDEWEAGRLEVFHEHLVSERLRSFLGQEWRRLSDRARGPSAVLATLPGERHDLALHMAATVLALVGWRVVFVGQDTPLADIDAAVLGTGAAAAVLAVSVVAPPGRVRSDLLTLRRMLPEDTDLVVGGLGAPSDLRGVHHLVSLDALSEWAASRA